MSVFDNIKGKAEDILGADKVAKAEELATQHADKVEEYSDKALDAAAGKADSATGGKYADQIKSARDSADSKIGNEGA